MNPINVTSTATQNVFSAGWPWSLRSILVLTICGLITIVTILG